MMTDCADGTSCASAMLQSPSPFLLWHVLFGSSHVNSHVNQVEAACRVAHADVLLAFKSCRCAWTRCVDGSASQPQAVLCLQLVILLRSLLSRLHLLLRHVQWGAARQRRLELDTTGSF